MATMQIDNIPDELIVRLSERAQRYGTTPEDEVLKVLSSLLVDMRQEELLLNEIRSERRTMNSVITTDDVNRLKQWGRE